MSDNTDFLTAVAEKSAAEANDEYSQYLKDLTVRYGRFVLMLKFNLPQELLEDPKVKLFVEAPPQQTLGAFLSRWIVPLKLSMMGLQPPEITYTQEQLEAYQYLRFLFLNDADFDHMCGSLMPNTGSVDDIRVNPNHVRERKFRDWHVLSTRLLSLLGDHNKLFVQFMKCNGNDKLLKELDELPVEELKEEHFKFYSFINKFARYTISFLNEIAMKEDTKAVPPDQEFTYHCIRQHVDEMERVNKIL